jgi:hypothetical protein
VKSDRGEENGALDSLVGVEQVPPRLAIAFKSAASVDIDVLATKQKEAPRILEVKLECVFLPEIGIVRECDAALDIHVYMGQIAQI